MKNVIRETRCLHSCLISRYLAEEIIAKLKAWAKVMRLY